MKKQISTGSFRTRKNITAGGLRGLAQSFVSVGIPTVIESSVKEEYSYSKRDEQKSFFHSLTSEIKVRV